MKPRSILIWAAIAVLFAGNAASAQTLSPGSSPLNPPPIAPPPPPRIEVPPIPQMDAPPSQPIIQDSGRGSFSDRISNCLDEAAAAGLGPNGRAAYSRACANQ